MHFRFDMGIEPFRPVGVVLYGRPAIDTITISHLAVDPDYVHGSEDVSLEIAVRLVHQVRTIARSIKGVTRVQLPYRGTRYLRVGVPAE